MWLSNLLLDETTIGAQSEIDKLLNQLPTLSGGIVFVSSEIGLGVMPANALARRYADQLGELNQSIAHCCERVTLVIAGLPYALKKPGSTHA